MCVWPSKWPAWKQLASLLKPLLLAGLRSPKYLLDLPPAAVKLVLVFVALRCARFLLQKLFKKSWSRGEKAVASWRQSLKKLGV